MLAVPEKPSFKAVLKSYKYALGRFFSTSARCLSVNSSVKSSAPSITSPMLGSLALHSFILIFIFGTAFFDQQQTRLIPKIDVDLVDIEFTTLDHDLSGLKKMAVKKQTKAKKVTKKTKTIFFSETGALTKSLNKISKPQVIEQSETEVKGDDKTVVSEFEKGLEVSQKIKMSYDQYLVSYINKYKTYPRIAERLKQQGVVLSKIVISKEGKLKDIIISKSSGFSSLDQGTINLIKSLAPFKPLPDNFKAEYKVNIPIEYILAGS